MSRPYLSLGRLGRQFSNGTWEYLEFKPGVNLLIGRPNTGKTKWLQTLNYLLGAPGDNPFEGAEETGLSEKYDSAGVELIIGNDILWVERQWRETRLKSKVLVNGEAITTTDFQHTIMDWLKIPLLHFPKGNPMSGQTWPELSFRTLLRHIYRRQSWGDIADQQPEGEQHACLLQFLGLAEHLFTPEYGQLVKLKRDVEQLKSRRENYGQMLNELAHELLVERDVSVVANATSVQNAQQNLTLEQDALIRQRKLLIINARDKTVQPEYLAHTERLGQERAQLLVGIEDLRRHKAAAIQRVEDLKRNQAETEEETKRMERASDAGMILADLKVTHCPACDQTVANHSSNLDNCFLCHQALPDEPLIEELGAVRLRFEQTRLKGELEELHELLQAVQGEQKRIEEEISLSSQKLQSIDNELAPLREAVSSLIQSDVSFIDMALGSLNERQLQLKRLASAVDTEQLFTDRIKGIEKQIEPLSLQVKDLTRSIDFEDAASQLEDGMNAYVNAINALKPGIWRHSAITFDISKNGFSIRVGNKRWRAVLGGTDTLYFLMAYHYGLLTLSPLASCHYPGILIVDVPGEFSGEAVEDTEDFIVQPFIDLLSQENYKDTQFIITGASFKGLKHVNRLLQTHVHIS
jgi:hypothetical protein